MADTNKKAVTKEELNDKLTKHDIIQSEEFSATLYPLSLLDTATTLANAFEVEMDGVIKDDNTFIKWVGDITLKNNSIPFGNTNVLSNYFNLHGMATDVYNGGTPEAPKACVSGLTTGINYKWYEPNSKSVAWGGIAKSVFIDMIISNYEVMKCIMIYHVSKGKVIIKGLQLWYMPVKEPLSIFNAISPIGGTRTFTNVTIPLAGGGRTLTYE